MSNSELKEEETPVLLWTKEIDTLLTSWCDNAKCFEWMHSETSIDYLKRLNERYEAWISTYDQGKLLIIDVDANKFAEKPEDFGVDLEEEMRISSDEAFRIGRDC
jgi:deoxyadenosine/deoxycytidine kinase